MIRSQKLIDLARQELPALAENLIVQNEVGYRVFDRFDIVREDNLYSVSHNGQDCGKFGSTRTALSWCIAEKYQQYNLAIEILQLDQRSTWAKQCIETRENLARRGQNDFHNTVSTKLQHRRAVKHQIDIELEKCIKRAKYLQNRGFANDTQRTSQHGSTKTSR